MSLTTDRTKTLADIAAGVERRGIAFYDTLARSTADSGARHVFQHLAEMEREHLLTFQKMFTQAHPIVEPDEYLAALDESSVFTIDEIGSQTALDAETKSKALELGIQAERDSILLYEEMRRVLPEAAYWQIDRIIGEEKGHLRDLVDLKKGLEGV